jgi:hypothetical protein
VSEEQSQSIEQIQRVADLADQLLNEVRDIYHSPQLRSMCGLSASAVMNAQRLSGALMICRRRAIYSRARIGHGLGTDPTEVKQDKDLPDL